MVKVHTVSVFGGDTVRVHVRGLEFGVEPTRGAELKLVEGERFQVDWVRNAENFTMCPMMAAPGYRTFVLNDECGSVWVDNAREVFDS